MRACEPTGHPLAAYQVTLKGGDLDGCTVDIVEALRPRDDGAWGFFDIKGDVTCDRGGFSYTSAGAWDGNGFHASGVIADGPRSLDLALTERNKHLEDIGGRKARKVLHDLLDDMAQQIIRRPEAI